MKVFKLTAPTRFLKHKVYDLKFVGSGRPFASQASSNKGVDKNTQFRACVLIGVVQNYCLYSSPIIVRVIKSRRMRWAVHVALMGEGRGVYRVLVGKPEGKRLLGRPRRRWEDNIRMDLQEVGLGYEDWIGLAQDRDRWRALVSAVRNLRVP